VFSFAILLGTGAGAEVKRKENAMKKTATILTATVFTAGQLAGCATASKDIAAQSVSPLQYQQYDCGQITAEMQRVHTRATQLAGRLDEAATNDKVITGVGLILFWPALFALGGTKDQEAEYARLKGEYDALQQVAIQKKCPGATPETVAAKPKAG